MNTPPFALRAIDHVVLRVVDLDRMAGFYRDVLGCTDERVQAEIGLYQLRAGDSLIDLVTIDGKLGATGGAAPGARRPQRRPCRDRERAGRRAGHPRPPRVS